MSTDIINHIEFPVAEAERSRRFYEAVLAPLGLSLVISTDPDRTPHGGARHGLGKKAIRACGFTKRAERNARSIWTSLRMTGRS